MYAAEGAKVEVGKPFYEIDAGAAKPAGTPEAPKKEEKKEEKKPEA